MSTGGLTLADRVAELREWITTGYARDLRVAAGLSQALAAQDCEVTASTVHRWETGSRLPRGRNITAYHAFLARLVERKRQGGEPDGQ
ncbi:helix-turn-helix transcriptional regulator [Actinosynnema pretiosum subsp. pretiosum]|uniref:Helix-turn-helix transcriptional regulator n=1 Tax=Actinosynnema pretiosum subsp. pretiosum TaxID=103721 RepID=A0AA45LBJ9_9PSEU|nr:helix-turn-helix transcriptional regulator [Actinosynnema pretiosum subsp. pretiosum]